MCGSLASRDITMATSEKLVPFYSFADVVVNLIRKEEEKIV